LCPGRAPQFRDPGFNILDLDGLGRVIEGDEVDLQDAGGQTWSGTGKSNGVTASTSTAAAITGICTGFDFTPLFCT